MGTARRADTLTKTNRTHGTAYTQTGRRAISEVETDGENEATPELNHRRWEKGRKTKSKAQGTMDYQRNKLNTGDLTREDGTLKEELNSKGPRTALNTLKWGNT